jgi:hypothetical protein
MKPEEYVGFLQSVPAKAACDAVATFRDAGIAVRKVPVIEEPLIDAMRAELDRLMEKQKERHEERGEIDKQFARDKAWQPKCERRKKEGEI